MTSADAVFLLSQALREHARRLRDARKPCRAHTLDEFHSYRYGEDDAFYPIDQLGRPWLGHRTAVARAELAAAGYEDYSRSYTSKEDPWRHVYWGGEVPLWNWALPRQSELATRVPRSAFLDQLAAVLESRVKLRRLGPRGRGGAGALFRDPNDTLRPGTMLHARCERS